MSSLKPDLRATSGVIRVSLHSRSCPSSTTRGADVRRWTVVTLGVGTARLRLRRRRRRREPVGVADAEHRRHVTRGSRRVGRRVPCGRSRPGGPSSRHRRRDRRAATHHRGRATAGADRSGDRRTRAQRRDPDRRRRRHRPRQAAARLRRLRRRGADRHRPVVVAGLPRGVRHRVRVRSRAASTPATPNGRSPYPAAASPTTDYEDLSLFVAFYCEIGDFMVYDDDNQDVLAPLADRVRPGRDGHRARPRVRPRDPGPDRRARPSTRRRSSPSSRPTASPVPGPARPIEASRSCCGSATPTSAPV